MLYNIYFKRYCSILLLLLLHLNVLILSQTGNSFISISGNTKKNSILNMFLLFSYLILGLQSNPEKLQLNLYNFNRPRAIFLDYLYKLQLNKVMASFCDFYSTLLFAFVLFPIPIQHTIVITTCVLATCIVFGQIHNCVIA